MLERSNYEREKETKYAIEQMNSNSQDKKEVRRLKEEILKYQQM